MKDPIGFVEMMNEKNSSVIVTKCSQRKQT